MLTVFMKGLFKVNIPAENLVYLITQLFIKQITYDVYVTIIF